MANPNDHSNEYFVMLCLLPKGQQPLASESNGTLYVGDWIEEESIKKKSFWDDAHGWAGRAMFRGLAARSEESENPWRGLIETKPPTDG